MMRFASHSTLPRSMTPASTVLCLSPISTVPPWFVSRTQDFKYPMTTVSSPASRSVRPDTR